MIKMEEPPVGQKISRIRDLAGDDAMKIFGGLGGMFFLEELQRGAVGTMTGFAYPEVLVEIYNRFAAGDQKGAAAVFDRYSNSFLKIYYEIPAGREDEIARKVLIKHLQSGNSYGTVLKERYAKFAQPELGPWVKGSKTVGDNYVPPVLEGWEAPEGH
jgi:dihydrodipicolinate synthase/N-acetylneuraminate lyase